MAGNSQAPGNNYNGELDGIILIAGALLVIFLSGWAVWLTSEALILKTLFVTVGFISKGGDWITWLYPASMADNFDNWSKTLAGADTRLYGWDAAKMLIGVVGHTLMLILMPFTLLRIFKVRKTFKVRRFIRRFDLQKLVALNADRYAAIASIVGENLLKEPLHDGYWAMARQPVDFALENELLYARKVSLSKSQLGKLLGLKKRADQKEKRQYIKGWTPKKMNWSVPERRKVLPDPIRCRLDKNKTDARYQELLGPYWRGPQALTVFQKCVLAILTTAIVDGLPEARELALHLAKSFQRTNRKGKHAPTIDDKGIDKRLERTLKNPHVKEVIKSHAYVHTVFMGLLERSWKNGVFITREFLWLKPVDRMLYLALNQLGGDKPWTEAASCWSHYLAECKYGAAIKVPCVEAATDGLESILFDEEWIGSEEGLASEIAERKSQEGVQSKDEASPTANV